MSEVGTTSKHTPGPWKVEEGEAEDLGAVVPALVVVTEKDEEWICAFPPSDDAGTDRANARLIAAAPELLEAADAYRYYLITNGWGSSAPCLRLEALIAKAKGEQP